MIKLIVILLIVLFLVYIAKDYIPKYKIIEIGIIIIISIFALLTILTSQITKPDNTTTKTDKATNTYEQKTSGLDKYYEYEVEEMYEALDKNAIAAKNQFEEKNVAVIGKLSGIYANSNSICIKPISNGLHLFEDVQCYIKENYDVEKIVSKLSEEQIIIVYGQIKSINDITGYTMNIENIKVLTDEQIESFDYSKMSQRNAIRTAEKYLSYFSCSRNGLISLLVFPEYGESYSYEDAVAAVDYLEENKLVDWNIQAVKIAQNYLNGDISKEELFRKMTSEYEASFTPEQAEYAINIVYQ